MSDNLGLTAMVTNPTVEQGTNLFNTLKGQLDAYLSGAGEAYTATYDSDGNVYISYDLIEYKGGIILPTGPSDVFDVVFDDGIVRAVLVVVNDSGFDATLKFAAQSTAPDLVSGRAAYVTLNDNIVKAVTLFETTASGSPISVTDEGSPVITSNMTSLNVVGDLIEASAVGSAVTLEMAAKATASEIRDGTADKVITPDSVELAAEFVTLSDGANIAVDWSTFINADVTLGGNRTLDNPTNLEPGTYRILVVNQDGTGGRTLSFGSNYKFPGGSAPTLSTDPNAVDILSLFCVSSTFVVVQSSLGVA